MRDVFLALACTALGLAGCGGSVVVDGTGEGGSSGGSTSSSSSTTSGGGGSTVTTGGGAGSTGTETGTGTGTETTTTTSAPIACGDASCDGATQQCCASKDGASCISPGDPCQGFLLQCSSSASCNPGEVCCASFGNGPNDAEAKCTADCKGGPGPGGGVQLCATDAECQNGGTCEAGPGGFLTCHKGGGPGGGG